MYLILCFTLLTRKRITFLFMFIILFLTGVRFLITLQEYTVTWQFKHRYSGLEWWNIKYSAFKIKWIMLLHCYTKPSKGFGHSFCVSNWTSKQGAIGKPLRMFLLVILRTLQPWDWFATPCLLWRLTCMYWKGELPGIMWPGLAPLGGLCHRFFRLESGSLGPLYDFLCLRSQGTPSGNEAFRLPVLLCLP